MLFESRREEIDVYARLEVGCHRSAVGGDEGKGSASRWFLNRSIFGFERLNREWVSPETARKCAGNRLAGTEVHP